ncbi:zinc finger protein 391-like isoform X4 [Dermacentor silvarum]|uniref:zinc finger protein 391-like isoform X4 n=1 Tax=Dermacentor silvarum TaxID=543639 RepID=UPI001899C314|nr:zinc finger protein 391-like isoform X4 [Dermacentor silvarum]
MLEEDLKSPRCAVCGLQRAANALLLPLPDRTVDAELHRAWVDFVRGCPDNDHWEPDSHTGFVCTLHFTSNWLRRNGGRLLGARTGAVPTLYPSREQLRRIAEANSVAAAAAQVRQKEVESLCPGVVATQCNVKVAIKSTCCSIKVISKMLQCTVEMVSQGTQVSGLDNDIDSAEQQTQYCAKRKGGAAFYGGLCTSVKVACSEDVVVKREPVWTTTEAAEIDSDVQDDVEEYLVEKTSPLTDRTASRPSSFQASTTDSEKSHQGCRHHCNFCDYKTDRASHLKSHTMVHTGERPFECHLCHQCFLSKSTLNDHLRTHTGERPFHCPLCPQSFTHRSSLKAHLCTHTGKRPFQCSSCPQSFTRMSNLKRHVRTHTGERPFQCPSCARSFSHKSTFNVHLRVHTGERPYQCQLCHETFIHRNQLIRHQCHHK